MLADGSPRGRAGTMLRVLAMVVAAAFVALLAYGLIKQAPETGIDDALAKARAVDAPDFELPVLQQGRLPEPIAPTVDRALADGRLSIGELRGVPVVLNFWASWCDPCRLEARILERGWRHDGPRGVLFLGLDQQDSPDDAREFLREYRIDYPNIREGGSKETALRYGATGLPETYFISAAGEVVGHVIGAMSADQLDAGVRAARLGRPTASARGGDLRAAP